MGRREWWLFRDPKERKMVLQMSRWALGCESQVPFEKGPRGIDLLDEKGRVRRLLRGPEKQKWGGVVQQREAKR